IRGSIRAARAGPRSGRNLRRHSLHHAAAHPRIRNPRGAGGKQRGYSAAGVRLRVSLDARRRDPGPGSLIRSDAFFAWHAAGCDEYRCADLFERGDSALHRGTLRLLHSRTPRNAREPNSRAALRVTEPPAVARGTVIVRVGIGSLGRKLPNRNLGKTTK